MEQATQEGLDVELFGERLQTLAGGDVTALRNKAAPTLGLTSLIESEDSAGENPVPAFWVLAFETEFASLSPIVPLTNIPSIDLDNQRKRSQLGGHRAGG